HTYRAQRDLHSFPTRRSSDLGLGAMQQLASDVGGLQRVLTNVKTRGGWSEWQLGVLLEEMLTPDQFAKNIKTRDDSDERVEFAIDRKSTRLNSSHVSISYAVF